MEYKKVSNEEGLSLELVIESDDYEAIWGGDTTNPSWDEYVNHWKKEYRLHVILLRKCIEANGLVGEKACSMANYISFKFSDGQHWGFTWRAWGDLMQSIVDKREGYMTYYM